MSYLKVHKCFVWSRVQKSSWLVSLITFIFVIVLKLHEVILSFKKPEDSQYYFWLMSMEMLFLANNLKLSKLLYGKQLAMVKQLFPGTSSFIGSVEEGKNSFPNASILPN